MYNIPFGKPIIGDEERQAVMKVLEGPILTHGPLVRQFETIFADYVQSRRAVALSSCTAALHLAYVYLGIGPGDEVIVPAMTHVATAHAVELCGAKPVFIDAEPATGNIDIDRIEDKVSEKTRAISVVHYLGMPVNMDRILEIAERHQLFVVEDCALALGSRYKGRHMGNFGDVGCFSFYPVKHITTAEGGMLITNNEVIAETVSKLRAFGIDRNIPAERQVPGMYDVEMLGFNYRLNELGAALGLEQMKRLPDILGQRLSNYECLTEGLKNIAEVELFESSNGEYESSCYCHALLLKAPYKMNRNRIMAYLNQNGVGTSVYYPQAVPMMSYYRRKYGYTEADFPVANDISSRLIALPVGAHADNDGMKHIVRMLKSAIEEVK